MKNWVRCPQRPSTCVLVIGGCLLVVVGMLFMLSLFYHIMTLNMMLFRFQRFGERTQSDLPLVRCTLEVLMERERQREWIENGPLTKDERELLQDVGYDENRNNQNSQTLLACMNDHLKGKARGDNHPRMTQDVSVDSQFLKDLALSVEQLEDMGQVLNHQWDIFFVEDYRDAMMDKKARKDL